MISRRPESDPGRRRGAARGAGAHRVPALRDWVRRVRTEGWPALSAPLPERLWLRRLLAALLYVAIVFPFVWSQLTKPDYLRMIDFEVYREAGRQVLSGGHDLYRFETVPLLLPFTYPPFPALLSTWLAVIPKIVGGAIWTAGEVATVAWIAHVIFQPVLRLTDRGRPFLLALLAGAALWLSPVREVVKFGQVDLFMMGLALADCVARRPRWPRGMLVGFATAVKLTPGLFIPYLWLTGRRRAAVVAAATVAAAEGLAQLVIPSGSADYWTRALFASGRLGSNSGTSNESIRGMLLRLHTSAHLTTVLWGVIAVAVLVVGTRRTLAAHRAGDELAAVTLVGLLSVAISPVSWIHHITWVMLAVAVVADDFQVPRRVVGALALSLFFLLRLPWWGNAIAMHLSSLAPGRLLQDSFGLAVLALVCCLPWRARPPLAVVEPAPARIGWRERVAARD